MNQYPYPGMPPAAPAPPVEGAVRPMMAGEANAPMTALAKPIGPNASAQERLGFEAPTEAQTGAGKAIMGAGKQLMGGGGGANYGTFHSLFGGSPVADTATPAPAMRPRPAQVQSAPMAMPAPIQAPAMAMSDRRTKSAVRVANDELRAFLDALGRGR